MIGYFIRCYFIPHRAAISHIAKWVAGIVAVSLLLEIFLFNINYFISSGYNEMNMEAKLDLYKDKDDMYRLTTADHVIEFENLNTVVHNIWMGFSYDQPAQNITLKIQFTDEAHKTYFDTTEYTVGVPEVDVSTFIGQSKYINLNTAGRVNNLRIEVVSEDASYPILLESVYLNAHHPFEFNGLRFALTLGVLLLVFMFRPKSAIYRLRIVENPRESKAGIIATVCVEVFIVSTMLLYGSNLVGVATSTYNYGQWDGKSIVNTFEAAGDNAQQYAELARSMANGKLYLEEEPPQWLQEMDDPYDKGARDELLKETGEDYLFDTAYYDGHYYVYFGVVPAILFYLPFYLLTGANFPTAIGVLIAAVLFILGCSALLDRFARYHFKRVSLGLYIMVQVPLVFCCGILYLVKFPTFYSLPIACGLAFSVWGLYFWVRGREAKRRGLNFFIGSLCMALVVGCRPQLVLLSLLAFPLFWRIFITERRLFTPQGAKEFACLIAPYLIVAAGLMMYNKARFGSFFDFGANYNLTVNDMTKRGWNAGRIAPALFSYFIQPPNVCGVFPFIQPTDFATTYMGQTIKETTFGGIFACLPVLWVLFFTPPVIRLRNSQRSSRTISGVITVLVISGALIAVLDAEMAGILQRYYADFSFMFLAAVVLLVFIVNENLPDYGGHLKAGDSIVGGSLGKETHTGSAAYVYGPSSSSDVLGSPATRRLLTNVLIAIVAVSVVYSVLLYFVPETGWYSNVYPWAYQDIIEMVQFWT